MKFLGTLALVALLLPIAASAQDSAPMPNPITSMIKQQVVRYGQFSGRGSRSDARRQVQFQAHP